MAQLVEKCIVWATSDWREIKYLKSILMAYINSFKPTPLKIATLLVYKYIRPYLSLCISTYNTLHSRSERMFTCSKIFSYHSLI